MKMTVMKMAMGFLVASLAGCALADDPVISDVVVRQRWPWSRLVDIDYVLMCEDPQSVDIAVTAYNGSSPLTLPESSFSGDLYSVSYGIHHIVWDPTVTSYTNSGALPEFRVALAPTPAPLYMIVDLTKSAGAADQIVYVTEAALTNDQWGAWVRNPVTNAGTAVQSVIWTGVTNGTTYKTDKLVLRRVPAGSYQLGDTQNGTPNATLTKDMYVGVFEVTQQQWNRVMNSASGADTQAKHTVCYWEIRENPLPANLGSDDPAVNWPSNTAVNETSFMGKLRAKTGISEFDLPTEAQWEYLCRAKTTTVFNDGTAGAYYDGVEDRNNGNTNDFLNALGWYKFSPQPAAAQPVGGKLPNAWGLYDTHGNVWEWCLDWYAGSLAGGSDPAGAVSGSARVMRGGGWLHAASYCRSAFRSSNAPSYRNGILGFRLVRTLP